MKQVFRSKLPDQAGVTLIELLVAVAIFATLTAMAANFFLGALKSQRFSDAMQSASDSARFSLERMAKTIRVSVINTPSGTSTTLALFHARRGIELQYGLRNGQIIETEVASGLELPLTTTDIVVESLQFVIKGVEGVGVPPSDGKQPVVTVIAHIRPTSVKPGESLPLLRLQTTLSQRCPELLLDCQPTS